MKKWENPTLDTIGVEKTECGAWRYMNQCMGNSENEGCYYSLAGYTNLEGQQCPNCKTGTLTVTGKWWSEHWCDGTCS